MFPEETKSFSWNQWQEYIAGQCRAYFPDARVHLAPSGVFHKVKGNTHIDMTTLLLPKTKVMIRDSSFGSEAVDDIYENIAESEGYDLIHYDGWQDKVWFPLNAAILPSDNGKDVVLMDSNAVSLEKLLRELDVEVIGVNYPDFGKIGGKINCQTNVYRESDNVNQKSLVYDRTRQVLP